MPERVVLPYHLEAPGGASGCVELYRVPGARRLRVTRVITYFPAGDYGELHVWLEAGLARIHPATGDLTGDQVVWDDDVDYTLDSGSTLRLCYRNDNDTETREAFIHIQGELL